MKRLKIILLLSLFVIGFSCKKDFVLTGKITGKVVLLTAENGDTLSPSGIKITLKSAKYGDRDTVTDAQGNFQFSNVQTGNYEVILGENPIGEYHYWFEFVGGEEPFVLPPVKLTYKSKIEPYELKIRGKYLVVRFRPAASQDNPKYLILYYKKTGEASELTDIVRSETDSCEFSLYEGSFDIKIYGTSVGVHSVYWDTLGNFVDPGLSEKYLEKTITIQ